MRKETNEQKKKKRTKFYIFYSRVNLKRLSG